MPVPVLLPRPAFIAAVKARIAWLAENRDEDRLENFLSGLADVRRRIEQNHQAGPPVMWGDTHVLRMRLFPRSLPYILFYTHRRERPVTEIYLVRLYGSGQDREDFDMSKSPELED